MEQCSPLGWIYYPEEEEMGELKRFLVQTTMELEATIVAAQDEISRKDEELGHMRELLMVAVKERDEAHYQSQNLLAEKNALLQQQLQLEQNVSFPRVVTNHHYNQEKRGAKVARGIKSNNNSASLTSSDRDESIISSEPITNPKQLPTTPSSSTLSSSLPPNLASTLGKQRALPEKGKLLQAVMEAGPLLQTLLLAGPLPQWQHPPPQLDRVEIPLVQTRLLKHQDSINGCLVYTNNLINKRGLENFDGSVSSSPSCSKYQRVV